MKTIRLFLMLVALCAKMWAQQTPITVLDSGHNTSLRGLSIVNNNIVWASGSNGTVAKSTDGGKTFEWLTVAGYEKRDFRDIEAFDANTAVIMAVAEPAIILKTKDGGKSWYKVFEDTAKGMFLDAMDFYANGKGFGVVVGDPINKVMFSAMNGLDSGSEWKINSVHPEKCVTTPNCPFLMSDGEAFFAASGTNVKLLGYYPFFVSGGLKSRLITFDTSFILPITQGSDSKGANSIDFDSSFKRGVIVGGDYTHDTVSANNCVLFTYNLQIKKDIKIQFFNPQTPPHGYRSCVAYITSNKLITCGTSGVDISNDGGKNWQLISTESFHVCQKAKKGNAVFLAGANGKIAKFLY